MHHQNGKSRRAHGPSGWMAAAVIVVWTMLPASADAQHHYRSICKVCDSTQAIIHRIPPPQGFTRAAVAPDSYAEYLRHLPLSPPGTHAHDWQGRLAMSSDDVAAVLDWRLLGAVEQCADIALRLVASHAQTNGGSSQIGFRSLSGQSVDWSRWLSGRYSINGDATAIAYTPGTAQPATESEFDRYLIFVMSYANSASLLRDWPAVPIDSLAIGDVLIQPFCTGQGSGHLSLIVDACVNQSGQRLYLFADGYTPARTPVIRQRVPGSLETAWMTPSEYLELMSQFGTGDFHRFPGWGR